MEDDFEVQGINLRSPHYMDTTQGHHAPMVLMEILGASTSGASVAMRYCLEPELAAHLAARLLQEVQRVKDALPPAGTHH